MKNLELFLDLDGVFSDFRDGVKRLLKIDIPEKAKPGENKQLQDFVAYKIWSRPFFWTELLPLPGALAFYENFKPYGPKILTAVPWAYQLNTIEAVTAGEEKRVWVRTQFGREQAVDGRFNYTKSDLKHTFCKAKEDPETLYVLIDDSPLNIKDWENAGGIGILHETRGENNDPALHAAAQAKTLAEFQNRVLSQLQ
jgi:hypothetical protein